mgnify:CR=1 FL=1
MILSSPQIEKENSGVDTSPSPNTITPPKSIVNFTFPDDTFWTRVRRNCPGRGYPPPSIIAPPKSIVNFTFPDDTFPIQRSSKSKKQTQGYSPPKPLTKKGAAKIESQPLHTLIPAIYKFIFNFSTFRGNTNHSGTCTHSSHGSAGCGLCLYGII